MLSDSAGGGVTGTGTHTVRLPTKRFRFDLENLANGVKGKQIVIATGVYPRHSFGQFSLLDAVRRRSTKQDASDRVFQNSE